MGVQGTPTYIPQNGRHNTLISLRYTLWDGFCKLFFIWTALRPFLSHDWSSDYHLAIWAMSQEPLSPIPWGKGGAEIACE